MSRRVATAARERRAGPLPEQRPTGWHRIVYEHPSPPVLPEPPGRITSAGTGNAPVAPAPVDPAGPHRLADPERQQLGRVLGPRPTARRRRAAVLLAAAVTAAVAAVGTVVLVSAQSAPDDGPGAPATGPAAVSTTPASAPASAPPSAGAPGPAPTSGPTVPSAGATPGPTVDAGPGAAVVTTLGSGDPGFGWPSTAFGSVPPGG